MFEFITSFPQKCKIWLRDFALNNEGNQKVGRKRTSRENPFDVSTDDDSDLECETTHAKRRRLNSDLKTGTQSQWTLPIATYTWMKSEASFDKRYIYKPIDKSLFISKALEMQNAPKQSVLTERNEQSISRINYIPSSTSQSNPFYSTASDSHFTNGAVKYKSRENFSVPHAIRKRRVAKPCDLMHRKRGATAKECIRLEEKEQYRQLLQQYTMVECATPLFRSTSNGQRLSLFSSGSNKTGSVSTRQHSSPLRFPLKSAFLTEKLGHSEQTLFTKRIWAADKSSLLSNGDFNEKLKTARSPTRSASTSIASACLPSPVIHLDSDEDSEKSIVVTKEEQPTWSKRLADIQSKQSIYTSSAWFQKWNEKRNLEKEMKKEQIEKEKTELNLLRKGWAHVIDHLERDIKDQLHVSEKDVEAIEDVFLEDEEEEPLPELTPEMEELIDEALHPCPPDQVLADEFRLQIRRRDMETLQDLNWLNDEIINFYMNLLMERGKEDGHPSVYACNTFFYPKLVSGGHAALKRWTRKVDIFAHDFMLVPVHLGVHWCLAVVCFKEKTLRYYDSMGGKNNECLKALCEYLKAECLDKKKQRFDMADWTVENAKEIPQQMNSSDCGMFACKYAEYLTRSTKITFKQEHMPYFRRQMVYEILTKRLL